MTFPANAEFYRVYGSFLHLFYVSKFFLDKLPNIILYCVYKNQKSAYERAQNLKTLSPRRKNGGKHEQKTKDKNERKGNRNCRRRRKRARRLVNAARGRARNRELCVLAKRETHCAIQRLRRTTDFLGRTAPEAAHRKKRRVIDQITRPLEKSKHGDGKRRRRL